MLDYAAALGHHAQQALVEKCTSDRITFDAVTELGIPLAYVFISGYFKQIPSSVIIEFCRENRQFVTPKPSPDELIIGIPRRHGSLAIDALFYVKSPMFFNDRYFYPLEVPLPHFSEPTREAVLHSRAYIEACESDQGRKLDPSSCSTIGGKIHMAGITPKDGFDWVPGFEHERE